MELTGEEESEMCPVCLEPFNDPRFLPCHHTLCTTCIQDVASRYPGKSFPCPSCRKPATLPRKGVQALQTNYYIKPRSKLSDAQTSTSSYAMCKVHEERLKYHCMDCKENVCSDCRLTTHKDHKARSIHEIMSDKKDDDIKMVEKQTEMVMVKQFKCSDERNTRVYWLYHTEFEPPGHFYVYVSFEQCGQKRNVPIKEFRDDGKYLQDLGRFSFTGMKSFKFVREGHSTTSIQLVPYNNGTMSKHKDYELDYKSKTSGKPCVMKLHSPGSTIHFREFNINVGHCRAFDVDSSDTVFIVIEDWKVHHNSRRVMMYRRPGENAICTYSPPNSAHFKPVDICFFTLNGEEVLMVADEAANDASIHVVKVGQASLTFERFLVTDCPVLQKPTALNFDVYNRLWVACKGGNIVALKEKCVSKAVSDPAENVKQRSAKLGINFLKELVFFFWLVFQPLCVWNGVLGKSVNLGIGSTNSCKQIYTEN